MAYHRVNDLKFLTDEQYDALADWFETRYVRGAPDDCWPWMGGTGKHGRGQISLDGQTVPAPRVAYLLYVADIPDHPSHHGNCVLHECDNPPCVNPKHLFVGTHRDNMLDKVAKGRQPKRYERNPMPRPNGLGHYKARLTDDQVIAIRADARRSREIADEYGISQSMVCNIKSYRCWTHIPPAATDVPVTLRRTENWRRTRPATAQAAL